MKDYTIEHSEFLEKVSIVETNDPAHADVINTPIKQLFGNTVANKKAVEDSKEQVESKLQTFKNEISASQAALNKSLEKSMNDIKESNAALGKSIKNIDDRITFIEKTQQLFDYKMYGEASYVFQRKDLLHALYEYTELSMNDLDINAETLAYFIKENKKVGSAFAAIFDIKNKNELKKLNTIYNVLNNSTAMRDIANSSAATNSIISNAITRQITLNNSAAMQAIANSRTAMSMIMNNNDVLQAILNNGTAMQAMADSSTAMNALIGNSDILQAILKNDIAIASICKAEYSATKSFIKLLNNNVAYMKEIYHIVEKSKKFQFVRREYADSVSNLNQYSNTPNTIIFVALGHYQDSDSGRGNSSLLINGEFIKKERGPEKPQSIHENNINAIAVAKATFTEDGDGYTAIAVYKALG